MRRGEDRRSPEALVWRRWYRTARWLSLRDDQLTREPLCRSCARRGQTVAAVVADHVKAHRGDPALFWDRENLQSLCQACHDGPKQREDRLGFSTEVDADGWPVDPHHRANRAPAAAPSAAPLPTGPHTPG